MAANIFGNAAATGLWDGVGTNTNFNYQLLVCDHSFYSGFFVSGLTGNCYKQCNSWCGDTSSPYFRTASTSSSYNGVAFNTNGHSPNRVSNRLISVGLRWMKVWPWHTLLEVLISQKVKRWKPRDWSVIYHLGKRWERNGEGGRSNDFGFATIQFDQILSWGSLMLLCPTALVNYLLSPPISS